MPDQQIVWTALPRAANAQHLVLDVFVSPRLGLNAAVDRYTLADFPELEHWTHTLDQHLTFAVETDDGTRHAAAVEHVVPLDHDAWDHLFEATTFVRPWSFRDLSHVPIYSFPIRFVTAYLRDLYHDVGRSHPTRPPSLDDLGQLVGDLGPVTDVRVPEERRPPPRDPDDLPLPPEHPQPPPAAGPQGCLAFLFKLFGPLWNWLCKLLHLPPLTPPPPPPGDPTYPTIPVPHTVHPSPYGPRPPVGPGPRPALDDLEAQMEADKAISPTASAGAMSAALAARNPTFDFTRVQRFYDRPEPPLARPDPPELDVHQALGALGDYPALLRALGIVVRLRIPRPTADPASVRIVPAWDGAARPTDVTPRTACTLGPNRFAAAERSGPGASSAPNAGTGSELASGALDLTGAGDRLQVDTPKFDVVQVDSDGAALKAILMAATLERRSQLRSAGQLGIDAPDAHGLAALHSGGLAIVRPDRAYYVHQHLLDAASLKDGSGDLRAEELLRGYRIEVSEGGGAWRSLCHRTGIYRFTGSARDPLVLTDEGYVKSTSATSAGANPALYVHEALARWTGWSLTVPFPGLTLENAIDGVPPGGEYEQPAAPRSDAPPGLRLETSFAPVPGTLPRLRFGHSYRLRAIGIDLAGEPLVPLDPAAAASDVVIYRRFEPAGPPAALALEPFWPGESLERIVLRSDFDRVNATYDQQVLGALPDEGRAHRTRHLVPPKAAQQMVELHGRLDTAFGPGGDPDAGYQLSLRESGDFAHPAVPFGDPELIERADGGRYAINHSDTTLSAPYLPDPFAIGIALLGVPGIADHVAGDPLPVIAVPIDGVPAPLLQIPFEGTWPDVLAPRLRVAEGAGPPHWDASERVLTIHLPKGAQERIRYSSYVGAAGLQIHGAWDWVDGGDASADVRTLAEHGAHWMVSPSRELVLVHAVQRPLTTARFTTLHGARTTIGQTTAALSGELVLDVASTGRIDVIGEWKEIIDDEQDGVKRVKHRANACDYTVHDWAEPAPFPPPPGAALHEFGDTRHRTVAYTVRATTRFREYLPENATDIWRDSAPGEAVTVNVLSSARPDAPRVIYAVPMFTWPSPPPAAGWVQHEQDRRGGGLRIYIDRPWYSSGEGELLAVVMSTADDLSSRYALDPTTRDAAPSVVQPLTPQDFPNRAADASGLSLAERRGVTANVAAFAPAWDAERKLWFADVQVALKATWPFVRFALARFQPDALDDAKLSHLVLAEFAQVAPDRRLTLTWQDPTHVRVVLRGRAQDAPQRPRVAVRVQRTTAPAAATDELDWEHAAGPAPPIESSDFFLLVEPSAPDPSGDVSWDTVIELPAPRSTARMRLEVAEYELLPADSAIGHGIPRVTYAAHVPLD